MELLLGPFHCEHEVLIRNKFLAILLCNSVGPALLFEHACIMLEAYDLKSQHSPTFDLHDLIPVGRDSRGRLLR